VVTISDMVSNVENDDIKTTPQRLCSEIQLFDLCELERCDFKDGRFCTDPRLLAKFEAIADVEDERPSDRRAVNVDDADDEDEFYDDAEEEEEEEEEEGYSVFDDEDNEEQDWER